MKSDNFLNNLIGYLYLKLRGNKIEKEKGKRRIAQMSQNSLVGNGQPSFIIYYYYYYY